MILPAIFFRLEKNDTGFSQYNACVRVNVGIENHSELAQFYSNLLQYIKDIYDSTVRNGHTLYDMLITSSA